MDAAGAASDGAGRSGQHDPDEGDERGQGQRTEVLGHAREAVDLGQQVEPRTMFYLEVVTELGGSGFARGQLVG